MCSGGLDSMTMLRIFRGLEITNHFPNLSYGAIHINWHVRNESTIESDELEKVFKMWQIDNYHILDSTIDPNDPDWNQKSTDFRFNFLEDLNNINLDRSTYFCLGHILPDMLENVISNICLEGGSTGKQTYFNLFGMQELLTERSVNLFRPLLLHEKPDETNTPFFKDNATKIIINRRVLRRALKEFEYDPSRIRTVYHEGYEIRQKYLRTTCPFTYEESWTLSEWRQVLNNFGGIKKGSIKELIKHLKNGKKIIKLQSGTKTIMIKDGTVTIS